MLNNYHHGPNLRFLLTFIWLFLVEQDVLYIVMLSNFLYDLNL